MKKSVLFFVFAILALLNAKDINIAAAANLSKVIYELKDEYLKTHNDNINITLNSSGALVLQINNNAPYDIFLSADENYANNLNKKDTKLYAKGCLAFYFKDKVQDEKKIKDIVKNAKCVVVANPKTAPYGLAAMDYIAKNGMDISFKTVIAHSISHALTQAKNGCGVGFVALGNAIFDEDLSKDNYINLGCFIKQNVALLNENARDFYDFLDSKEAREIFKKYGYE